MLRILLGGRRDTGRPLTAGECAIAESVFGAALDPHAVRIHRARWFAFQPRRTAMAPDGDIWFVPGDGLWRADFAAAAPSLQRLFVHELTHCWQHQRGLCLPIRRHPFCRYDYAIVPGRALTRYGIEQQAMIVEHAFAARQAGEPDPVLEPLLPEAGIGGAPPTEFPVKGA
jgi:hypothetical protein